MKYKNSRTRASGRWENTVLTYRAWLAVMMAIL